MSADARLARLTDAIAEEIYDQLGRRSELRYDLWLMEDGSFTWRHSTWPAPEDGVEVLFAELDVEDLLGPYWSEGLDVDADGKPIVTEKLARGWAEWWASDFGQNVLDEMDEAIEQARAAEAEWSATRAEIQRKERGE